jgi:hypothetical protein
MDSFNILTFGILTFGILIFGTLIFGILAFSILAFGLLAFSVLHFGILTSHLFCSPETSSEQRVRELLDRPSVRELLATRARNAELDARIAIPAGSAAGPGGPFRKPEDRLEDYPPPPSYDSVAVYTMYEPPPPYQGPI